jgi:asparagine synthase (glutamine-hydrolysing)
MCGIAGAIFRDGAVDPRDAQRIVAAMVAALAHRGPDGSGVLRAHTSDGLSVTLGHTRLAILDLSERGAQPMRSARTATALTFNGEIYNFAAVRAALEQRGRTFVSESDSEVLLHGYDEWGTDVLARLEGMFAFAVWDDVKRRLFIARDRLGIKPVYYWQTDTAMLFASEVRALLASGLVPRRLDPIALDQFLAYQTVPAPRTLIDRVQMLPPGHTLEVGGHRCPAVLRRYWDLLDDASPDAQQVSAVAARAEVTSRLTASAAMHLVSDVPVGVFLSGGIDSSAIVALTRRAGVRPRTFSVVLPGTPEDEARFARTVATRFNADHTEIVVDDAEFGAALPEALVSVDHPSGDGLNTFLVSRAVRRAGVKVALSGVGGDELFGGYPSFRRLGRVAPCARAWKHSPWPMRAAVAATVRTLAGASIASTKTAAVLESDGSVPQAFPVLRQLFSRAERRALIGAAQRDHGSDSGDPYVDLLQQAAERHPRAETMTLVSYAEARTYMHDVLLRDADQMSMAHGLEVRVPLLDRRLTEYVMGLPETIKRPGDTPKRLLVESLGDELPVECVRRPKQGFVLPFDRWMKTELRAFCERQLFRDGLGGCGVFDAAALASLWQAFLAGDRRTSWSRPWTLVALGAWLAGNGVTP